LVILLKVIYFKYLYTRGLIGFGLTPFLSFSQLIAYCIIMAISYVSRVLEPLPYIAPIDSSLVQKALLNSQQRFDQGVEKVQQTLDVQNSKDILHPELRKYYRQKMADITNQVNSLGGADFGDRNISSQISGLAMSSGLYTSPQSTGV
jgi:hypothetical protein